MRKGRGRARHAVHTPTNRPRKSGGKEKFATRRWSITMCTGNMNRDADCSGTSVILMMRALRLCHEHTTQKQVIWQLPVAHPQQTRGMRGISQHEAHHWWGHDAWPMGG